MDPNSRKIFKRTNSSQIQKLVELMEQNPDIAKGLVQFGASKKSNKEYWDTFAVDINTFGPPIRSGKEWHKVWLDYKLKLKKKIAANKREIVGTGGGPYSQLSLSPIEQAVDALLNIQQNVNPSGVLFGPRRGDAPIGNPDAVFRNVAVASGSARDELVDLIEEDPWEINEVEAVNIPTETPCRTRNVPYKEKVNSRENERMSILKEQTSTQADLLSISQSIDNTLKDIATYAKKTFELKSEELALLKAKEERKGKENREKSIRHKEKLDLQLRALELKASKRN